MIVTLFSYWDDVDPIVVVACPEPEGRQRIRDAVDAINQGILNMAQTRPIVIANPADVVLPIYARLENGFLNVGGELIDFTQKDNEPHSERLENINHNLRAEIFGPQVEQGGCGRRQGEHNSDFLELHQILRSTGPAFGLPPSASWGWSCRRR